MDDHLGITFLLPYEANRGQHCTKIISRVEEIEEQDEQQVETIKLLVQLHTKDHTEELIAYNQVMEHVQRDLENEQSGDKTFKFRDISGHQGPVGPDDPHYKGNKYNVMVE